MRRRPFQFGNGYRKWGATHRYMYGCSYCYVDDDDYARDTHTHTNLYGTFVHAIGRSLSRDETAQNRNCFLFLREIWNWKKMLRRNRNLARDFIFFSFLASSAKKTVMSWLFMARLVQFSFKSIEKISMIRPRFYGRSDYLGCEFQFKKLIVVFSTFNLTWRVNFFKLRRSADFLSNFKVARIVT